MHEIRRTRRQASGNDDNNGSESDKSQHASKFSIYGCIASVVSLSILAVACQLLDHFNYNTFTSDVRITTLVENQGSRFLSDGEFDERIVTDSSETFALPPTSEIIDVDCGDIFLFASHTNEKSSDGKSNNQSALLCHYARNCKSSGWPSRILLPLLLCHGVDDSLIMPNATTTNFSTSQSATKPSRISTTLLVILLFAPLLLYLLLLFRLLATTADNYFSPSLETFSFELGLPPRFAGATLLALGNGSPDLGSTVNAILLWNEKEVDNFATATADGAAAKMKTQGWIMSLGSLIGGGMFVGTIVCGLLVNQCSGIQCRAAFLRDVSMYALSVGYVWHVLESKRVTQVDALVLLGIYVVYVGIVFCADVFHRKITVERINMEAKERRKSIREEKALRLSQLYDAMRAEISNLGAESVDELTPIVPYASRLPSYIDDEGEAAIPRDEDMVPDILPSFSSTSYERQVPRPRLSVSDRFALLLSNYDPSSVRHLGGGSTSTVTDESREDSELFTISAMIHDIRPPLLRAVSSSYIDASSTHSPPDESGIADELLLSGMETPQHSNIPSPPPSDTSSIASKARSWSFELLIDAYEELVFQSHRFMENSFQSKTTTFEKIVTLLEMPFSIARVLTIPLPVEDHYCRPIVALSTACSPLWILYYREVDFFTASAASFILVALMIALSILRYADENKMPLIACIPLSLYGFLIAATWIDSIGGALVDLLQFFGTFLRIPPGILGMTVLAVGNSMGDLSSNLAMARNGLPNMATTAAFAGPAFNLLVGVGCGFLALQRKLDTTVVSPVTLNATIRIGFMFIIVNCLAIALCGMSCQWRVPKRYCYVLFAWYALFILTETLGSYRELSSLVS
jgi:sodium/potassium/calcium exchanger 6